MLEALRQALGRALASIPGLVRWEDVADRLGPCAAGAELLLAWLLYPPAGWPAAGGWSAQLRLTAIGGTRQSQADVDAALFAAWLALEPAQLTRTTGRAVVLGPGIRSQEWAGSLLRGSLTVHIRVSAG